jgi:hypothetical protein
MLFDSGGGVNGLRNDDMMRVWVLFIFCINHVGDLWSSEFHGTNSGLGPLDGLERA